MTKKWTIRNELVKRKVKALLKDYNAKLKQLELDQYDMNIDAVVNYIVGVGEVSVDIIQYGREWIKEHEDQKCSRNHLVALNAFIKFVGRDSYMCNDITKVFMKSFEKWLGDKKTARLWSSTDRLMWRFRLRNVLCLWILSEPLPISQTILREGLSLTLPVMCSPYRSC